MADRSYLQLEEEIESEDSNNVLTDPETAGEDLKFAVRADILRLLDVIETLRVLDVEMPAQVISCFLFIASRPDGCTTAEMQEELGLTAASMSRNTTWLTGQHRSNPDRGLNLITKKVYEPNKRLRYLRLTQQGRNLANKLSTQLNG
ncbi:transcriptional regulator/ MarR family [Synechococcus sp. A15-24]|nr:transcriptional regulator/ MarR family [Synechococcus sp. A15-24]